MTNTTVSVSDRDLAGLIRYDNLLRPLGRQGWELINGVLHAPDRKSGNLVPLWHAQDVMAWAPVRRLDDPEALRFRAAVRLTLHPGYFGIWLKWLTASLRRPELQAEHDAAFHRDVVELARAVKALDGGVPGGWAVKALAETVDTAGGALVPVEVVVDILARVGERAIVRPLARVVTTSRDRVLLPRFQPAAAPNDAVFESGFIGDWVTETPSQVDADFSLGTFEVPLFKARARTLVSNDLFEDAPSALQWLVDSASRNLALVEDRAFLAGDGVGKPLGLLSDANGIATVNIEGSTANTISATATNPGSIPKLFDVEGALPDQYAAKAVWVMRRATERSIRKLADAQNRPVFPPERTVTGERTLLGYPVRVSSAMPAEGTDGAKVVAFGDFGAGFLVAQHALFSVRPAVVRERYIDRDQVLLILTHRVGGGVHNPDAFRLGVV
jgi:HK97 family phage major capsid protein